MKKLFVLFLLFSFLKINAQACTYAGGECTDGLSNPSNFAIEIVQNTCRILNIPNINIYRGNLGNACATLMQGQPIISYNPDFLNFLGSNNSWAPISVIAHEVGHHLNMDASWYGQFQHPWSKELRADYVSGYVLAKMGCSLYNAQSAFRVMFNWMGTESHPDTPRRMQALAQGYQRAINGF